jgi:hypothetical protein
LRRVTRIGGGVAFERRINGGGSTWVVSKVVLLDGRRRGSSARDDGHRWWWPYVCEEDVRVKGSSGIIPLS